MNKKGRRKKTKRPTAKEVEKAALSGILGGFNQQSCAMPSIALRFLELNGAPDGEIAEKAVAMYREVIKEIIDGKDLVTCQLASYYLLAELTLQGAALAPVPAGVPEDLIENPPPGYQ